MKKVFISIIIASIGVTLHAQTQPVNFTGWYGYEWEHSFKEGKPWGFFGEGIIKRDEVIIKEMQYFIRLGTSYKLKSGNGLAGGFAYQYNFPYDAASKPYDWPDYRIWEQYTIHKTKPKGAWTHRFRMEQRWLGRKSDPDEKGYDNYKFENTFRYMIRKTFVLSKKTYAILYDEIHLRFLTADPEKILDQNRMYAGIGIHLDKNKWWRLEAGYMYQPVFENSPDADGKERTNHALRITLISEMPLKRQKSKL